MLVSAPYGSVVAIDSVLVRFNKEQKSYKLLMAPESFTRMIVGVEGPKVPDKLAALKEKYGKKPFWTDKNRPQKKR